MPWPSLTEPFTWIAGQLVTALRMNQEIRDRLNHLKGGCFPTQQFRNLKLRCGAANIANVVCEGADEIVMDDGTRVADWPYTVAFITSSGAGGLDTGSEVASLWYAIYAIRKTSDGTRNLLLSQASFLTGDQSQATHDGQHELFTGATTNVRLAQSFTPSFTGAIAYVDLTLVRLASPVFSVFVTIEADSSGAPSGTALSQSELFPMGDLPTTATTVRIPLPKRPTLTASTTYWIVLQSTQGSADATNRIAWRADTTAGGYAGGAKAAYNGTTWTTDTDDDFVFTTGMYVQKSPVMPSGYDQKALVGFVFNNASSNFEPFIAHNRRVMLLIQKVPINAQGNITPILFNLFDSIPARPCLVECGLTNTLNNTAVSVGPVPDGLGMTAAVANSRGARMLQQPVGDNSAFGRAHGDLLTDYQACYFAVSAGSGTVHVGGYEWC